MKKPYRNIVDSYYKTLTPTRKNIFCSKIGHKQNYIVDNLIIDNINKMRKFPKGKMPQLYIACGRKIPRKLLAEWKQDRDLIILKRNYDRKVVEITLGSDE